MSKASASESAWPYATQQETDKIQAYYASVDFGVTYDTRVLMK